MENSSENKNKLHSFLNIPFFSQTTSSKRKSFLSLGVVTCAAMSTLIFASSFKTAYSEPEKSYNQSNTPQTASSNEKNQSAEIESLRKQVQATARKFKEYQAQLFRSSHPKDQNKIAELGQLLSEKEKLNSQLSNSIKALEKELNNTRKQVANLEMTSEALNSLLNTAKNANDKEFKNLNEEIARLSSLHEAEKQNRLSQLEQHENEKQHLTQKVDSHETDRANLIKDLENKYEAIIEQKNDELQAALATIQANEKRNEELENNYNDSSTLASDLTNQLAEAQAKHSQIQQDLSNALKELEESKSSLLDELRLSKNELDEKTSNLQSFEAELNKALSLHETQQSHLDILAADLVEAQFKLTFNEQHIRQLNDTATALQSKYEQDIHNLEATLDGERVELSVLKNQIETLNDDKTLLESINSVREAELISYKQQAKEDLASAELGFAVNETRLTAYQLLLEIEVERLHSEISEANDKLASANKKIENLALANDHYSTALDVKRMSLENHGQGEAAEQADEDSAEHEHRAE